MLQLVNVANVSLDSLESSAQNAIVTSKALKSTYVNLTVVNVNVKMDIQEFIVTLTFQNQDQNMELVV